MIRHLTTFVLSFCIALPVCWCCTGGNQGPEQTGCCAMSGHCDGDSPAPEQGESNCPCAKHEDMRDVADTAVKAPVLDLKPLFQPAWGESVTGLAFTSSSGKIEHCHDHGPPRSTVPFYTRYHALLL